MDIDYSKGDVWSSIELLFDCAVFMYSTHSHREDNERYRLVFPLNREVSSEEYQAISRMLASEINIEIFDDTTFEPARLMYNPTTPKDGQYVFKVQDGPWINADEYLNKYTFGWEDASTWPVSSRVSKLNKTLIDKQQDPLIKEGMIGAFCRTYSITEAMEIFLANVYTLSDDRERATYNNGSTSNGVLIYDDKFSYSYHSTDPTSLTLCNSFDLVRINLFKNLDEEVRSNTSTEKLPSFIKMMEFTSNDKKVQALIYKESLVSAKNDFEIIEDNEEDLSWLINLTRSETGKIINNYNNVKLILENDSSLKNKLVYNEFTNRLEVINKLPWKRISSNELRDADIINLGIYIEKIYKFTISSSKLWEILRAHMENHSINPIKTYLTGLTWDGVQRVETLFIDYFGAEDNKYIRSFTKKWLCGAVARIFVPGIKFDYMLILVGDQGVYKSTMLRKLAKGYFTDSIEKTEGNQAIEKIIGAWIIEFGELQAFSKSEINSIKGFISAVEDKARLAYAKTTSYFKRQCVFAGTTNDGAFLRDKTGNRRYWIIDFRKKSQRATKNVVKDLDKELDQIWAEAVHLWKVGIKLYPSNEEQKYLEEYQEDYMETDELEQMISDRFKWDAPKEQWNLYTYTDIVSGLNLSDRMKGYARQNLKTILSQKGVNQELKDRKRVYNIPPMIGIKGMSDFLEQE
ncbi:virulence-associated E family protein [Clostridium sp. ZS1]|uniref:virulence-associated E family protein n=1 Tax=Clostridium sp. ZS1 TaxID=2949989 RepID=UPI00207A371C|nr:virulence-associated E family protein [Clostridium sp. ZS1]